MRSIFLPRLCVLAFASLFLSSCLDLEQEVTLEGDGSGELALTTKAPARDNPENEDVAADLLGGAEAKEQAKASGVEILEQSVKTANGQVISKIRVAFDTVEDLNQFMSGMNQEGQGGIFEFSLEEGDNGTTFSHRAIPVETKDPEGEENDGAAGAMAEMMMANLFKDASYVIRWTLPGDVLSATEGATIKGDSVTFEIPLIALTKPSGVDVSATYEKGLPGWVLPVGGGLLLLVVGLLLGRLLSRK